ncbi:MAG: nuclease [Micrococcales bacterium]|nr:MAG: nuclease [Micrococcales bacterium]
MSSSDSQHSSTAESPDRFTYVIVDGENIDATLGGSVFGRRPHPEERPRWERVTTFAAQAWGQPVKGLFFLAASNRDLPVSFIQALLAMEYRPIPLAGGTGEKVVDIGIQRTLEALAERPGDVLLASHDGDFLPQVSKLLGGDRRVGLVGFREFVNSGFVPLTEEGLELFDLERDIHAFTSPLPRIRAIPIEEFDPLAYL